MFVRSPTLDISDRKKAFERMLKQAHKHKFSRKAIYAGISFSDKYLSQRGIYSYNELEEIFLVCLYAGAKMEEVEFPCHRIYLANCTMKMERLVELEIDLIQIMDWRMTTTNIMYFFDLLAQGYAISEKAYSFAQYVAEILLYEYGYFGYQDSLLASGLIYLVFKVFCGHTWPGHLGYKTGYSKQQVVGAANHIMSTIEKYWEEAESDNCIEKRFASDAFHRISQFRIQPKR